MEVFLFLMVLAAVMLGVFAILDREIKQRQRREDSPGGFEVKLNTGEAPVLRDRKKNHG